MPRDPLPVDRDAIRDFIRELRETNPELKAEPVARRVEAKFGIKVSLQNFYVTYWAKSKPNGTAPPAKERAQSQSGKPARAPGRVARKTRGTRARQPRQIRKQKARTTAKRGRPRRKPLAVVPVRPEFSDSTRAVVVGEPIIQVYSLSNGMLRLQCDMEPNLGGVLQAVGGIIRGRNGELRGAIEE